MMADEGTEREGGNAGEDGDDRDDEADERVLEFLRTADRPRQLASDVAAALDVARGRVRTRLQALADEDRVVRTRAGTTARWAVPERTDEPDPVAGVGEEEPQPETDVGEEEPRSETDAGVDGPTPADGSGSDTGTAEGSTGASAARPTDTVPSASAPGPSGDGDGWWRPGSARLLALAVGTVLALAAIRHLGRR